MIYNAAFSNNNFVARNAFCKTLAHFQGYLEVMEVAVVYANQSRLKGKCAIKFGFIMHFDQYIHAQIMGCCVERARFFISNSSHYDQDAVRSISSRFIDLVGIKQKIFS